MMIQQEREEETVGLTDMVLDGEPRIEPPQSEKAKDEVRDPARDGADEDADLPLAGQ